MAGPHKCLDNLMLGHLCRHLAIEFEDNVTWPETGLSSRRSLDDPEYAIGILRHFSIDQGSAGIERSFVVGVRAGIENQSLPRVVERYFEAANEIRAE